MNTTEYSGCAPLTCCEASDAPIAASDAPIAASDAPIAASGGTESLQPVCSKVIDLPVSQILMDAVDHPGRERHINKFKAVESNPAVYRLGLDSTALANARSSSGMVRSFADINLCNYRNFYTGSLFGEAPNIENGRPVSLGKSHEAYVATSDRLAFDKSGYWVENAGRANDQISITCERSGSEERCTGRMSGEAFRRDTLSLTIWLEYASRANVSDSGEHSLSETVCALGDIDRCVQVQTASNSTYTPFITDVLNRGVEDASLTAGLVDSETKPLTRALKEELCETFDPSMRTIIGGMYLFLTADFATQTYRQVMDHQHARAVGSAALTAGTGFLTYCLLTA